MSRYWDPVKFNKAGADFDDNADVANDNADAGQHSRDDDVHSRQKKGVIADVPKFTQAVRSKFF